MKYVFNAVLFCLFFVSMGYASSVTKTVGTSDSTYNYPTIAAAFAAINAGSITDGNGDLADSVIVALMDSTYNESELTLSPPTGRPSYIGIGPPIPWQNQGSTNRIINISPVLGTGVGFTVEGVKNFVMAHVTLTLDTSSPWTTGMDIHRNTFQALLVKRSVDIDSCDFSLQSAPVAIKIQADSGGTFAIRNSRFPAGTAAQGTIMEYSAGTAPQQFPCNLVVRNNSFAYADTAVSINGVLANLIDISGNTFDSVGAAIVMDSVDADTINIEENSIAGPEFDATKNEISIETIEIAHHGIKVCSIRKNKIHVLQPDSTIVGISLDGIRNAKVNIDSNKIDMGGSGTGLSIIKHPCLASWGIDDVRLDILNTQISNASKGIEIKLDNDTTGLGGIPPDSLTFGSFDISGNTLTAVKRGFDLSDGILPEIGAMESLFISHNTLTGDGSPTSVGIFLDSLLVHYVAVDSNIVTGFANSFSSTGLSIPRATVGRWYHICLSMNGNQLSGGFKINSFFDVFPDVDPPVWSVAHNTFTGGGTGTFEFNLTPADSASNVFASVDMSHNTFSGFSTMSDSVVNANLAVDSNSTTGNILALRVSTARRQSVDAAYPLAHHGRKPNSTQASDTTITATFRGNSFVGLGDGEINANDVNLDFESNTFHGTGPSLLPDVKTHPGSPGSVLTGNALRVSTARRQSVDAAPPGGHGTKLTGNTFSDFTGDGVILTVKNYTGDTMKVLVENNTFSNNGGNGLEIVVEGDSGFVDGTITGNTFSNNSGDGLLTRGRTISSISNNELNFSLGQGGINIITPSAAGSQPKLLDPAATSSPNSFINNGGVGLELDSNITVPDGIHNQNFSNNGSYNFVNKTTNNIDVTGCWWGTSDSSTIAAKIFDGNDSAGLGVSNFLPFLTESIIQSYVALSAGWNLVSVPAAVSNYATTDLFPNANSKAFAYAGSYHAQDTLKNGVGYWIKTNAVQSQLIVGLKISSDSIDVVTGWNMIGAISSPVKVTQITSIPGGIVTSNFFGYNGSYTVADSIRPGSGYWVKVNTPGKLVLSSSPSASPATAIHIVPTDEQPPSAPGDAGTVAASQIPKQFDLKQNYPNPFNPTTVISVDLPSASVVTLKIFNMLGEEVATLLNDKEMVAGSHNLGFNASNLPSGVYFYRLTGKTISHGVESSKNFGSVRKMLFTK